MRVWVFTSRTFILYFLVFSHESSAQQIDAEGLTGVPVGTGTAHPLPPGLVAISTLPAAGRCSQSK